MATRKTPAAKVEPQQYAAGQGWDVGDVAPATLYAAIGDDGAPVGPASETHPGGHATILTTKGQPVGTGARAMLDALGYTGTEG